MDGPADDEKRRHCHSIYMIEADCEMKDQVDGGLDDGEYGKEPAEKTKYLDFFVFKHLCDQVKCDLRIRPAVSVSPLEKIRMKGCLKRVVPRMQHRDREWRGRREGWHLRSKATISEIYLVSL